MSMHVHAPIWRSEHSSSELVSPSSRRAKDQSQVIKWAQQMGVLSAPSQQPTMRQPTVKKLRTFTYTETASY